MEKTMSKASNMSNLPPDSEKEGAVNSSWILGGLVPFIPSGLLAIIVREPLCILAPLYGFCPLDFLRDHSSPPTGQVLIWGLAGAIVCSAFAVYAYFIRRFGWGFAMVIWASAMLLVFRCFEVAGKID